MFTLLSKNKIQGLFKDFQKLSPLTWTKSRHYFIWKHITRHVAKCEKNAWNQV